MKKQPEVRIQSKTGPRIGKKIGDIYKRQAFLSFRLSRGHLRYLEGHVLCRMCPVWAEEAAFHMAKVDTFIWLYPRTDKDHWTSYLFDLTFQKSLGLSEGYLLRVREPGASRAPGTILTVTVLALTAYCSYCKS